MIEHTTPDLAPTTTPDTAPAPAAEPETPTVEYVAEPEPGPTSHDILAGLINRVTAIQWLAIRKRYDEATTVLASDYASQLLIANWRKNLEETGKSEWEQFEQMGSEELTRALGIYDLIQQEAQARNDDADKSD